MSENQENTIRKYNIGTVKHPYPMMRNVLDGGGHFVKDLGVLQSDDTPLHIHSEKTFSEVAGMMFRDMPTPSMLDVFLQGQIQRQPDAKRKVEFFMGDAGAGKSFLGALNGKMRSQQGALLVDCGGRDLNELIYETVLDHEGGKATYDAIDKALAEGTLNTGSINSLRSALGKAMSEHDGKYSIDWEEVGIARIDEDMLEAKAAAHQERLGLSSEDLKTLDEWNMSEDKSKNAPSTALQDKYKEYTNAISADTESLHSQANRDVAHALDVVGKVASLEGLSSDGGASIGLKTREGALIRAWKENRPIILDEFNKGKPGTDDAMQVLLQVFTGEMDKHTVSKGGESFTFDRAEWPEHFFVTGTGNKTRDGFSTRSLSASAYQRWKPVFIAPPEVEDLQHRICQKLTGMPVSTIFHSQEEYWSENKEQFTDFLIDMRKRGLSDEQQANIPSWQFEMLKNWENVMQASEQLAGLYDKWAQVIDPDSKLHEAAPDELSLIQAEIDKQYAAEVGVGLRSMMNHMDKAETITPKPISGKASVGIDPNTDWDQPDDLPDREPVPVERHYGTRLSEEIMKDINDSCEDRELLLQWLTKQAAEAGLFEMLLDEGKNNNDILISGLLDIDPEKAKEVPENIEEIHELLCEYLREKFPDIAPDVENTDIISPSSLEHVLTELNGMDEVQRLTTRSGVLQLPAASIGQDNDSPITTAMSVETALVGKPQENFSPKEEFEEYDRIAEEEKEIAGVSKLPTENLVDAERYMISLAIPGIRKNNIDALFSDKSHSVSAEKPPIAEVESNTAANGLAATTVLAKTVDENGAERDEFLHVVHDSFGNRNEGRTLVTGTIDISPRLEKALESTGVTYVNRNAENAADKINKALDEILEEKKDPDIRMCNEHVLTMVLGSRVNLQKSGETTVGAQKVPVYDLPHGEQYLAGQPSIISDELRGKHRENLVSLLSDDRGQLEKSTGDKLPVMLTDSPDLDHLKNTVRSLTNETEQQKSAGRG